MSGDGLVSVRLPRSLLGAFSAAAERQSISIHEAARHMIFLLPSLTPDALASLPEPPRELDAPRVSFYLGWDVLDVLMSFTSDYRTTNSTIFRRLLYGLFVTKRIEFVQQSESWKLQIKSGNNTENMSLNGLENGPSCA